ncbi:MAG: tetratricopeptide repeat protein [Chloroflexota bacterium]
MRTAADLVWNRDWEEAAEAYEQAVEGSPRDLDALAALGMCYARAGRFRDAAEAYARANDVSSGDPVLLQRLGEAWERSGEAEKASEAYLESADLLVNEAEFERAKACWQAAVRVQPTNVDAHLALLKHYQERGKVDQAITECLQLCRIYRKEGQSANAVQICEHALRLSPRCRETLSILQQLRAGQAATGPGAARDTEQEDDGPTKPQGVRAPDAEILAYRPPPTRSPGGGESGPTEGTRQRALRELAESAFQRLEGEATGDARGDEDADGCIAILISEAIDLQRRGSGDEAIRAYETLLQKGFEHPAVHYGLGLLYQENLRLDDAEKELEQVLRHPTYSLGGHFALGECARAQGRVEEARARFLHVLEILDRAAADRDQSDEVRSIYQDLAESQPAERDEHRVNDQVRSMVDFMTRPDWVQRIRTTRHCLDMLTETGPLVTLGEALLDPHASGRLESLAASQEHVERGAYYTALEECYLGLHRAPTYLPIHRQLAVIVGRMGRPEEGVDKLVAIGNAYRVRGAVRQALGVYRQALKRAPMDTALRSRLIELEAEHGDLEKALREQMILADSFERLAQLESARETYEKALRLARSLEHQREWEIRILHEVGDLAMRTVDWNQAETVYRQICDLSPDDERARLTLMELHFRRGQSTLAMNELDELIAGYKDRGEMDRAVSVLKDVDEDHPNELGLHLRVGQAYLDAGRIEEARDALDRLAELQAAAGQLEEARATIETILALYPEDAEAYEDWLGQITES